MGRKCAKKKIETFKVTMGKEVIRIIGLPELLTFVDSIPKFPLNFNIICESNGYDFTHVAAFILNLEINYLYEGVKK